ncbi:MAG: L,D-transpeptidase [Methylobacteriaceae bacterium]|nr:L,D-transpeptidase [Methylobacteriaceae bacterium]
MIRFARAALLAAAAFAAIGSAQAIDRDSPRAMMMQEPAVQARLASLSVQREQPRSTRAIVADPTGAARGTITIDTEGRRLYLSLGEGRAVSYGVGVGREGFEWKGRVSIGRKAEWPDWTPPAAMLKRRPDLPAFMPGGEDNPLGARAMYLYSGGKDTIYRIHGTNEADTIGEAVSSGCIRMLNDDVADLYDRVKIGTPVVVM